MPYDLLFLRGGLNCPDCRDSHDFSLKYTYSQFWFLLINKACSDSYPRRFFSSLRERKKWKEVGKRAKKRFSLLPDSTSLQSSIAFWNYFPKSKRKCDCVNCEAIWLLNCYLNSKDLAVSTGPTSAPPLLIQDMRIDFLLKYREWIYLGQILCI